MPISRRRSGIDITALSPFVKDLNAIAGNGAYQTILSINGKGFLESFYAYTTVAALLNIRITIDGVVKVLLSNNAGRVAGVANRKELISSATTGNYTMPQPLVNAGYINTGQLINVIKSYPITDSTDGLVILGDAKIYFNSSLLLEISLVSGNNYNYHYSGGFQ